jgi:D-beta-D-heptose 7-phosphate kinase/D-beta-D-heptose 1-phosphate adenosyltransferase
MPPALAPARAREIIGRFTDTPLVVVGDVMLDQFIVGRVDRISPEAPVPVVRFDHENYRVGGSANVAHNIRALGGRVELAGVVGADEEARLIRDELETLSIGCDGVIEDSERRTTRKVRVVTMRNQQVARIDYEKDEEIATSVAERLAATLDAVASHARALVVSDYSKGAITRGLMRHIIQLGATRGVPVLVDPKLPHLDYYTGATVITPNHYEAETATHTRIRTTDDARTAARALREYTRCGAVLITRGEQGMWLLDGDAERQLPAATREVADVTGAGDTVIATLALAVASGATLLEAAVLANAAAGVTVGKFGPSTLTQKELLGAIAETGGKSGP